MVALRRSAEPRQLAGVASSILALALLGTLGGGTALGTAHLAASLTQARLTMLLEEGVKVRRVPPNLDPPLARAGSVRSIAYLRGCLLLHKATTNKPKCVFGDPNGANTVVLFGDSKAAAWSGGVNLVSQQQHWRLITMVKVGCTWASVLPGSYMACVRWRKNTMRQIARLHPEMVVVTSGDYVSSARPLSGVRGQDPRTTWLNGVNETFTALRRMTKHVVFIANVPRMKPKQRTYRCVQTHVSNVFPCTVSRRDAFPWPGVRRREFQLAKANGVDSIDPAPWFCTTRRCPVIVNDILVFRDSYHITPQWSAFLAPMLALRLVPAMNGQTTP